MDTPRGLKSPKRAALTLPLLAGVVVVAIAAVVAWSHLSAKGPAPQLGSSPQQVATADTPATRDGYTAEDFTEPKSK